LSCIISHDEQYLKGPAPSGPMEMHNRRRRRWQRQRPGQVTASHRRCRRSCELQHRRLPTRVLEVPAPGNIRRYLRLGPGTCRSPRQRMPANLMREGSECVRRQVLADIACHVTGCNPKQKITVPNAWRVMSARPYLRLWVNLEDDVPSLPRRYDPRRVQRSTQRADGHAP